MKKNKNSYEEVLESEVAKLKEKSNLFTKLMGLFKKGDK